MARIRHAWARARAFFYSFDQRAQADRLRRVNAALLAANDALKEAQHQLSGTVAPSREICERQLMDMADACKAWVTRLSLAVKIVSALDAAVGVVRRRKPKFPYALVQQRLRDFDREEQEQGIRRRNEALAQTRTLQATALARVNAAASELAELDLLAVADAGRAAAEHAYEYEAITKLVGTITNCRHGAPSSPHYQHFERLLKAYRELAKEVDYPGETDGTRVLEAVLDRMATIRITPEIASRNSCIVVGGFSSGKSSFLNALIGDKVLPTGITPTTSIPTFIVHGPGNGRIRAFNPHGGSVEIESKALKMITHDFKRDHGIAMKRLVRLISISTPKFGNYGNVVLVDTPGYATPEEADADYSDKAVVHSISQSRFLVWVVDCERGTLPDQDVVLIKKFLGDQISADGRNTIYFVLNKAEKQQEEDREDTLREVVEACARNGITYFGVALYSASHREWFGHVGQPFEEFLNVINGAKAVATKALEGDVEAVFSRCAQYHTMELKRLSSAVGLMKRLASGLEDDQTNLAKDLGIYRRGLEGALEIHGKCASRMDVLRRQSMEAVRCFVAEIEAMRDMRDKL